MSVNIRLAKSDDQQQCSELLDVLAKATSDSNNIFDSNTFNQVISNERGSLVIAEENGKILGMGTGSQCGSGRWSSCNTHPWEGGCPKSSVLW